MTTLPSFVELMASLGLSNPIDRPRSTSPNLLHVPAPSPTRSRSSRSLESLRDQSFSRNKGARFSPYRQRRDSVSSSSSSSSPEMSFRTISASPGPSPTLRRRVDNKLTVNIYGSVSDLSANTPISSYVRKKTPNHSPTSPTFSYEPPTDSPSGSPMPFSLPTLPSFIPQSAVSDSFPLTPNSDLDASSLHGSPNLKATGLPDIIESSVMTSSRSRGIRISTPRSADLRGKYANRVVHVA